MSEDDIDAVIAEAEEMLRGVQDIYPDTLEDGEPSARLKVRIKCVLENQRSSLDFLAVRIVEAYGKAKSLDDVNYPLARKDESFEMLIDGRMPRVRQDRLDIANEIRKWQPYNQPWLKDLNVLVNKNKHRALSPQTAAHYEGREATTRTGGKARWPAQGLVLRGAGRMEIGDEVVDPTDMRTPTSKDITLVDWLFTETSRSALGTLSVIQAQLPKAIQAIRHIARL